MRGLVPHFADVVVAQLQGDGEDVLEDCLGVVDAGELDQLPGDLVPHPPLLGVLLQHQEHVDEVLSGALLEELHELRQVGDSAELQRIGVVFEDGVEGCEHVLLRKLRPQ